jgi:hypothetical protein
MEEVWRLSDQFPRYNDHDAALFFMWLVQRCIQELYIFNSMTEGHLKFEFSMGRIEIVKDRFDTFLSIQLSLEKPSSIVDCLRAYLKTEEGESKFSDLPNLLVWAHTPKRHFKERMLEIFHEFNLESYFPTPFHKIWRVLADLIKVLDDGTKEYQLDAYFSTTLQIVC